MEEYKFNSENSFTQQAEQNASAPITPGFRAGSVQTYYTPFAAQPAPAAPKAEKKRSKAFLNIAAAVTVVALCFVSGALGARLFAPAAQPAAQGQPAQGLAAAPLQATPTQSFVIEASGESKSYIEVASIAKPSVVEITTEKVSNNAFFSQYITSGAGSGVIISADGYIMTNQHVISGANKITVRLSSGTTYEAKVIGSDAQGDIAVIKIDEEGLPFATVGDSTKLVVGQEVLAIGNPLGELGGTVTNGIISALGREVHIDGQKMTLLQTNAAINPGNSGGGLFNMKGELIAIVNAKSAGSSIEGLGFAIPINEAYTIAQELIKNGYVSGRPAIGISYIEISNYMDLMRYGVNAYGIYIYDGGETELKNGDRIVKFGDYEVQDATSLRSAIQNYKVGDVVTATVVRDGRYTDVSVTLVENKPTESGITIRTEEN